MGKEDPETMFLFFGGQFKYPVGVVLSISVEGVTVCQTFLEVESRLRQLPGEGAWDGTSTQTFQTLGIGVPGPGMELPAKHPRLFRYRDARSWGETLTKIP